MCILDGNWSFSFVAKFVQFCGLGTCGSRYITRPSSRFLGGSLDGCAAAQHVVYGASLGGLNCGGVFENCAKNYDTSSHIHGIVVAIRYE